MTNTEKGLRALEDELIARGCAIRAEDGTLLMVNSRIPFQIDPRNAAIDPPQLLGKGRLSIGE